MHSAAEHRDECAVESLALAYRLRAISSSARLIDFKNRAQFGEESRFKLRVAVRVQLLLHSVARDQFCVESAATRRGALVSDGNYLCSASEADYHNQNGLMRRPERQRALVVYIVDVDRADG